MYIERKEGKVHVCSFDNVVLPAFRRDGFWLVWISALFRFALLLAGGMITTMMMATDGWMDGWMDF